MKRIVISLMAILFLVNGCLIVSATEYRISFDEDFKRGKIKIIFENLRSDHIPDSLQRDSVIIQELQLKRHGDFDDLLEMVSDDEALLDALDMGIYLKKRYLFAKDNKLNGCWDGIFEQLHFFEEGESFQILENKIELKIKKDDEDEYVETDGQLTDMGKYAKITWPKTQREIYWKIISKDDQTGSVSLIDEYKKWKRGQELE